MKLRALLLAIAALGTTASPVSAPGKVSYDGYKVYRVPIPSSGIPPAGIELQRRRTGDNSWAVDLAVAPAEIATLETSTQFEILSHDLGADLAAESAGSKTFKYKAGALPGLEWFNAYHPYADHGIHLWGKGGKDSKSAIFFNGNVHAREWITSVVSALSAYRLGRFSIRRVWLWVSGGEWGGDCESELTLGILFMPQVVEYILYQLVTGYNKNDTLVQKVLDNYDFYVLPVVNPDGFVYTQTTNRLWRKNRQVRANTTAVGTDINRNWSVGWGGDGSSPNPSSETFSGLRDRRGIKLYVDWHSYAQVILLSYGYTCTAFPANIDEQEALAAGIAAAIARPYGTTFDHGPGCLVLYQSSGNGRDYLTDVGKAQFGWGIELRDTQYGFVLPPEQILPSGIEVWEGLKYAWSQF
ncbi:hypothetical protein CIB48_g11144 [Xylaria polymorpha]|nr:hypothetical protein CIB48_g11144 [Xylaria polymorpha]